MKKFLKILGIIIGIFVLIFIIGYISISSFLKPPYLRSLVERLSSEAINYPVQIKNVSLKLGLKVGIGVNGVSLKNPPGFSERNMVDIDRIRLNLKLLPLLRRQIVINSIMIEGAEINIEKNKDNYYNIAVPRLQKREGPGFSISLDRIWVSKTDLYYRDLPMNKEYRIRNLRQDIQIKEKLIINGSQTLEIPKTKEFPGFSIKIENKIEYDTITKNITIKEIKGSYGPIEANLSGSVERGELLNIHTLLDINDLSKIIQFIPEEASVERLNGSIKVDATVLGSTKEPKVNGKCELINIQIKVKNLNQEVQKINGSFAFDLNSIKNIIIQGLFGTSRFDITGGVSDFKNPILDLIVKVAMNLKDIEAVSEETKGMKLTGIANLNIAIKGRAEKPNYLGDFSITDGTIDGIGLVKPITNLKVKGTIQNDGAKISECSGHIGRSDFSFNGYVSNFKSPVIQINNNSNLIDIDELFPRTKAEKKTESKKGIPLTIQGNVRINRLTGMDMEFRNINTEFKYENGIIDLKNCNAETFDGRVSFDFYYNINAPEPYRINTRMENINVQKILKRFLKFENLQGRLSGVNNFQGRGFEQKQVISNLTASGNIKITNGVFHNFEFTSKLCDWLGLKGTRTINLDDLVCSYKIENGRMSVEDWSMQSSIGNFLVNGTIRLDGVINLLITLTLNKKESDLLKNYHADWILYFDQKGRATIDIIATGKILSPEFRLDTNKMQQRLKGAIKDEFDKKKKELEKKLKDLFKK
uniref:AsmA family protein n=1 Tax=candidate division WOR-3 bacterium TaxID=2052148 RepID=A0A7V3RH80_UNCW3